MRQRLSLPVKPAFLNLGSREIVDIYVYKNKRLYAFVLIMITKAILHIWGLQLTSKK
jgi:hypothetical protein